jgi:Protein of unknown function (DUF3515)
VSVEPLPAQSPSTLTSCYDLISDLPASISAGQSWAVEPSPDTTKAWGSPSVVLRCGDQVPPPEPAEQLLSVDGIDWRVIPLTEGDRYTTVGRTPGIEVTVPAAYAPTASILAEIAEPITANTVAGAG